MHPDKITLLAANRLFIAQALYDNGYKQLAQKFANEYGALINELAKRKIEL